MKRNVIRFILFAISFFCFAEDITISLNGRTVVLHDDFTWGYVESHSKAGASKMKLYYDPSTTIPYKGENNKYILHIDNNEWKETSGLNPETQFEFENFATTGYGILIYEGLTYPLEVLKEAMIINAQSIDPNARIMETEECIVNNSDGELVTYTANYSGLDFIYFSYITTSKSGTIQYTFFTLESEFDRLKPSFIEAISGFEFIL